MSQISLDEAADLLRKLLSERVPVQATFSGRDGTFITLFGFVDSLTNEVGLVVSESGPPLDVSRGYLSFAFNVGCTCWYGEKRELAEEIRSSFSTMRGDSVLYFLREEAGERLSLFFNV